MSPLEIVGKVTANATPATVLAAIDKIDGLYSAIVEARRQLYGDALPEWIREHGELTGFGKVYRLQKVSTTKCRDKDACWKALLEATDGDIDALCGLLSSQPFKHGACKKALGADWSRHFMVETREDAHGKAVEQAVGVPEWMAKEAE